MPDRRQKMRRAVFMLLARCLAGGAAALIVSSAWAQTLPLSPPEAAGGREASDTSRPANRGRAADQAPATAKQSPSPGDHNFTVRVGELERRYTVHVPPGYDGKTRVPVVVMLHGGGGTSRAAATETGWGAKADEAGFLAVFPDAMSRDPSEPSSFAKNPQLWNDGSDRFYPGQKAPDDVAFLNAMLDELLAKYAVDARRIFLTGFSNGSSMSFRAGAELS